MKIEMKIKHRSHRYDINRPRSRHGRKHSKYKTCLSKMMLISIKQHLNNILEFMKRLRNTEAELRKCFAYEKKRVLESDELHLYVATDDKMFVVMALFKN